jgi:mono/diheme cytochrome c family protein
VNLSCLDDLHIELRREHRANEQMKTIGATIMKKLLVLATILGCATAITASAADAKENWDKACAKCHGPDGKGDTKMGQKLSIKDLTDAKVQAAFTDDDALKALKEGLKDAEGKTRMKAAENLSDEELKALVQYVRGLKK